MILLSVNFHYIGDEAYPNGGIYPISPEKFRRQLEILGRNFDFVALEDIHEALVNKKELPERSCLITFDDGLRCQYEQALPVLEAMDIPAGFFINGLPFFENKVCTVHKIHKLRSAMPQEEFHRLVDRALLGLYNKTILEFIGLDSDKAAGKYRYDDRRSAEIKYLLNSLLSESQKDEVVGKLFAENFPKEKKFCEDFYLSFPQIKDLSSRGWLGIHTYSHRPLSLLTERELEREIGKFKIDLEKELPEKIFTISYPYGSVLDINPNVIKICKEAGLLFGFTMERAFNQTLNEPLVLARVDTNDAPGGKSPAFGFDESANLGIKGSFTEARRIYFSE